MCLSVCQITKTNTNLNVQNWLAVAGVGVDTGVHTGGIADGWCSDDNDGSS